MQCRDSKIYFVQVSARSKRLYNCSQVAANALRRHDSTRFMPALHVDAIECPRYSYGISVLTAFVEHSHQMAGAKISPNGRRDSS